MGNVCLIKVTSAPVSQRAPLIHRSFQPSWLFCGYNVMESSLKSGPPGSRSHLSFRCTMPQNQSPCDLMRCVPLPLCTAIMIAQGGGWTYWMILKQGVQMAPQGSANFLTLCEKLRYILCSWVLWFSKGSGIAPKNIFPYARLLTQGTSTHAVMDEPVLFFITITHFFSFFPGM